MGEVLTGRLERPDAARLLADDKRPAAGKLRREARALRVRLDGLAGLLAAECSRRQAYGESTPSYAPSWRTGGRPGDAGRVNVLGPLLDGLPSPAAYGRSGRP